jgi:hypothetical protein
MKKLYIFLEIIVVLVIITFSIPYFLSLDVTKPYIERFLSKSRKEKISLDSIKIRYLGPQQFKNLHIQNEEYDLYMENFYTDCNLFKFIKGFFPKDALFYQTKIKNGSLKILDKKYANTKISNINLETSLKSDKITSIFLKASTYFNNKSGKIDSSIDIDRETLNSDRFPSFRGNLVASNIPVIGIDHFLSKNRNSEFFTNIFGKAIDLNISANINKNVGPMDFELKSFKSSINFSLNYSKEAITLRTPANFSIMLTEALSHYLFSKSKSSFFAGAYSKNPINLQIDNKNFYLPIKSYNVKDIQIERAILDFGQITAKKGNTLVSVLNIIRPNKFFVSDQMHLWFAPQYFSVKNGVMKLQRMDFLINNQIHLCTWGYINLINQKIDMVLGITADALRRYIGIKNLPRDFVLQVPISGTLSKIKIDASEASTKIAALVAAQAVGRLGFFLGTAFSGNSKVPPPKKPFPWDGSRSNRSKSDKSRYNDNNRNIFDDNFFDMFH